MPLKVPAGGLELAADNSRFERSTRSEEHTSELQSRPHLVCRPLLEKKKKTPSPTSRGPMEQETPPARTDRADRSPNPQTSEASTHGSLLLTRKAPLTPHKQVSLHVE